MSVQRLELNTEGDSAVEEEELTVSLTAADVTEEQQKAEGQRRSLIAQHISLRHTGVSEGQL